MGLGGVVDDVYLVDIGWLVANKVIYFGGRRWTCPRLKKNVLECFLIVGYHGRITKKITSIVVSY